MTRPSKYNIKTHGATNLLLYQLDPTSRRVDSRQSGGYHYKTQPKTYSNHSSEQSEIHRYITEYYTHHNAYKKIN